MPKFILSNPTPPYSIPSEFRGQKWPSDTDEGRTARSAWATYFAEGRGVMDPGDMPKSVALQKTKVLKPMFLAGFWNVDQTVKEIIEEMDPGRHQFIPINLTTWFDKPIDAGERFLLNVFHHQSSIIDDMTNAEPVRGYEDTKEKIHLRVLKPKVTVDVNKLDPDIHLWREERYLKPLFVSDDLYNRLKLVQVKVPVCEVDIFEPVKRGYFRCQNQSFMWITSFNQECYEIDKIWLRQLPE